MEIILEGLWWVLFDFLLCYPGALILKVVTRSKESVSDFFMENTAKSAIVGLVFWIVLVFAISRILIALR